MIIYLIIGIIITGFLVRVATDNCSYDEINFDDIKNQIAAIIAILLMIVLWPVTVISKLYNINKNH